MAEPTSLLSDGFMHRGEEFCTVLENLFITIEGCAMVPSANRRAKQHVHGFAALGLHAFHHKRRIFGSIESGLCDDLGH